MKNSGPVYQFSVQSADPIPLWFPALLNIWKRIQFTICDASLYSHIPRYNLLRVDCR